MNPGTAFTIVPNPTAAEVLIMAVIDETAPLVKDFVNPCPLASTQPPKVKFFDH